MNILFMCVANSARSQMAEGLARNNLPASIGIYSAGSMPSQVNPHAVLVMQEIGIDISNQSSKSVEAIPKEKISLVITLCSEEVCPVFPGKIKRLHWPISDPAKVTGAEKDILEAFRQTRDLILQKIKAIDWNQELS